VAPTPGSRTPAPGAGGAPAIAAYVAARLGVDTQFVGGVGADEGGQVMRRAFDRAGWVHLPGSALASTALAAFVRARRAGARTSLDPNVCSEALGEDARNAPVRVEEMQIITSAADPADERHSRCQRPPDRETLPTRDPVDFAGPGGHTAKTRRGGRDQ
jgi:sugar/nucleoside kinase (ribokinase family)